MLFVLFHLGDDFCIANDFFVRYFCLFDELEEVVLEHGKEFGEKVVVL